MAVINSILNADEETREAMRKEQMKGAPETSSKLLGSAVGSIFDNLRSTNPC